MTIKWVKSDPLVMGGEPFVYGTRLTVRQLLELRSAGCDAARLMREHPELRLVGIAAAWRHAIDNKAIYAAFFDGSGALAGPGLTDEEAASIPEESRVAGVVGGRRS
jgi:uncharacterized protein (DUF433 family)